MIVAGVSSIRRNRAVRRRLDVVAETVQVVCDYRGGPVTVTHAADVVVEATGMTRRDVLRRFDELAADGRLVKVSAGRYSQVAPALAVWKDAT